MRQDSVRWSFTPQRFQEPWNGVNGHGAEFAERLDDFRKVAIVVQKRDQGRNGKRISEPRQRDGRMETELRVVVVEHGAERTDRGGRGRSELGEDLGDLAAIRQVADGEPLTQSGGGRRPDRSFLATQRTYSVPSSLSKLRRYRYRATRTRNGDAHRGGPPRTCPR